MKKILVINSSARGARSHSRKLTEVFIDRWKSIHDDALIIHRELGNADVPHISENWITAAFKPEAARTAEETDALRISDTYIAELHKADIIVLGSPMYNWSIPSALKAYIDQVLRVNETWKFNTADIQNPYIGLLENKTLYLLLSRGAQGYEVGGYNEHMNFQSNYLKTVFNIIGISDIHLITVNGQSYGPEEFKRAIDTSHQDIRDLVEQELSVDEK